MHSYSLFSPPPPISRPSFLDLPDASRNRVYERAGLLRHCPIDLNRESATGLKLDEIHASDRVRRNVCHFLYGYSNRYGPNADWSEASVDCVCRRKSGAIPVQLFRVSRKANLECSRILYGRNKFKVCRSRPGGLQPLLHMSAATLSHFTALTNRLMSAAAGPVVTPSGSAIHADTSVPPSTRRARASLMAGMSHSATFHATTGTCSYFGRRSAPAFYPLVAAIFVSS